MNEYMVRYTYKGFLDYKWRLKFVGAKMFFRCADGGEVLYKEWQRCYEWAVLSDNNELNWWYKYVVEKK